MTRGDKMASPQSENGHTRIANEILDHIVKLPLNGTESRLIMAVWRYTYGFSRKDHKLSISFLLNYLEMKQTQYKQIKNSIDSLIDMNLLIETKKPDPRLNTAREIAFNKDYDLWCKKTSGAIRPEVQKDQRPLDKLDQTPLVQLDQKDKQDIKTKDKTKEVDSFFESVWILYPNKLGKSDVKSKARKELMVYGYEQIKRCIDRYKSSKEDWKAWKNGSTFFNNGYKDYLDAEWKEPEKDMFESGTILPGGGCML
jgi:phage replication O-like protein O